MLKQKNHQNVKNIKILEILYF